MNPFVVLAAAESAGPAMIPDLLEPDLDPVRAVASPRPDWPAAVHRRCADRRALAATAARWMADAARIGAAVVTPDHHGYPAAMRDAPLRPLVLFARGDVTLLERAHEALAIVGSRTPTAYGRAAVSDFAAALADSGVVIWSGLAAGVDAGAHEACVAAGTPTVAVLAGGIDHVYPASHRPLVERIIAGGGLCVSELPPGRRPQRGHFPRRNRILALATSGVLVVEAGLASGSLHTARFAADAGVPVWAVPGPYTSDRSRGCHRLIADGALVAADPPSLLRDLGVAAARPADGSTERAARLALSADARAVADTLAVGPRPADLVRRECGLDDARFLGALVDLLERGRVVEMPGGLLALAARG